MRAGALARSRSRSELGEQEVTQMIDAQGRLEPVGGLGSLAQYQPGVVDEHV